MLIDEIDKLFENWFDDDVAALSANCCEFSDASRWLTASCGAAEVCNGKNVLRGGEVKQVFGRQRDLQDAKAACRSSHDFCFRVFEHFHQLDLPLMGQYENAMVSYAKRPAMELIDQLHLELEDVGANPTCILISEAREIRQITISCVSSK